MEQAKATKAGQHNDDLSGQVNTLSGRVDDLSGQVNTLSGRVDGLSGQVNTLSGRVAGMSERVDDLGHRMDSGFGRVDADIRDLRGEMGALQRAMLQLGGGMIVTFVVGFASILIAQLA